MNKNHENLFTPFKIANCEIKNRYAMVAMGTSGMVTRDGTFNDRGIEYYIERAKGGVGLIITGTMYVENEIEKVIPAVMPNPNENKGAFIMSSSELTERVHAYDCKIFAQLTAGFGRVIKPHLLLKPPISSCSIEHYWDKNLMCRELSIDEIKTIVEKSGDTALICKQAGFDGIEIHAVHEGYLLDQFAISFFNNRTDEYGGDLKGRLKFACDIVKNIKLKCGEDFPVVLRYSLKSYIKDIGQGGLPNENFIEKGRDNEEGIEAAKILVDAGYDCLDVDAGTYDSWYWAHPPMYFEKGMNIPFGKIIKENLNVPVIVAGRMENPELASKTLSNNFADIIGLGRSLLADPYLVNKIKEDKFYFAKPCLGCHEGCMNRLVTSKPMCCAVNPTSGRESLYGLKPIGKKKKIAIIGAGPAGMEAARVLKLRGHDVAIYEKNNVAGGSLNIAGKPDFKKDDIALIDYYLLTLNELEVKIFYNTEINENNILFIERDSLIVATGSFPKILKLNDCDEEIINAEDVLLNKISVGDKIAIIGGGLVGCELALHLSLLGKQVKIIESQKNILSAGASIPHMNKTMLRDLLNYNKIDIIENSKILSINKKLISISIENKKFEFGFDNIISAVGYYSNNNLYNSLRLTEKEIYLLGDARKISNVMYAIWDAYELANNL